MSETQKQILGPVDLIALEAAQKVEDEFAKGHTGGVTQRRASIQVLIVTAIHKAFDHCTSGLMKAQATEPEKV